MQAVEAAAMLGVIAWSADHAPTRVAAANTRLNLVVILADDERGLAEMPSRFSLGALPWSTRV